MVQARQPENIWGRGVLAAAKRKWPGLAETEFYNANANCSVSRWSELFPIRNVHASAKAARCAWSSAGRHWRLPSGRPPIQPACCWRGPGSDSRLCCCVNAGSPRLAATARCARAYRTRRCTHGFFTTACRGTPALCPGPGTPEKGGDRQHHRKNGEVQPDRKRGAQPRHQPHRCGSPEQWNCQGNSAAGRAGPGHSQHSQYRFFHKFSPVDRPGLIPVCPL